jgi:hypothetical protein
MPVRVGPVACLVSRRKMSILLGSVGGEIVSVVEDDD